MHIAIDPIGLAACLVGIHVAYQWDALFDDVQDRHPIRLNFLIHVFLFSLILLALVVIRHRLILPIIFLSLLALIYVPLKHYISKNFLTLVAWYGAIILLPFEKIPWSMPHIFIAVATILLLSANVILYDLPDMQDDRNQHIKSLTQSLGKRGAARIAAFCAGVAALIAIIFHGFVFAPSSILFIVLALNSFEWLAATASSKFIVDAILFLPGLLSLF